MAAHVTTMVRALAGVEQAAAGVGAVGNVVALASPEFTVATWTVQLPAPNAAPVEPRRLREQRKAAATRRAPHRLRGLPSSLSLAPRRDNEEISWSRRQSPDSWSMWPSHRWP